jgi:uncharacterized protein (TIGR03435 family)
MIVSRQPCLRESLAFWRFGVSSLCVLAALGVTSAAQAPLEFEVASIKRNTTNTFASGPPPNPASGQVSMTNVPVQTIVLRAYPLQTVPAQVVGLPDWARSENYDVIAKGKPGATADEQQQMWKALLAERMKLAAHYETRELPGYNLVFARSDKRLGPDLNPSTLDCTKPPGPLNLSGQPDQKTVEAMAMSRCGTLMSMSSTSQGILTGGITSAALARLISSAAGRPVIDRTGLEGYYSMRIRFARDGAVLAPPGVQSPTPTDEVPSLFTAVQDQLGLKLESATVQVPVLIVDHIERPTEN